MPADHGCRQAFLWLAGLVSLADPEPAASAGLRGGQLPIGDRCCDAEASVASG